MSDIIDTIFKGLLPGSTIEKISADPDPYLDEPLTHLGLDSLSMFEVLSRIESEIGHELDYDELSYDSFSTLRGLLDILSSK